MGYDIEMDDFHDEKYFKKRQFEQQKKELEKLLKEITDEAKKVVENYVDNPSDISGSLVNIHQNSPFLDSNKDGEPSFSGSRWTKVIRSKI